MAYPLETGAYLVAHFGVNPDHFILVRLGNEVTVQRWDSPIPQPTEQQVLDAIANFPNAVATFQTTQPRTLAQAALDDDRTADYKALRGVVAALVDEINVLLVAIPQPISTITRSGTVATVTTPVPHGLSSGATVRVMGAVVAAYNISATITVTNVNTFTYPGVGSATTPAAGSLFYRLASAAPPASRTLAGAVTAIKAKIAAGAVD